MATHLKRRIAQDITDEIDQKVRQTVEGILAAVKRRGDAAVREYSEQFDKWTPKKLSKADIDAIDGGWRVKRLAAACRAEDLRTFLEVLG